MSAIIFPFEIFESIRDTIGKLPAETGGMLGGDLESGLITHFHFDKSGECGPVEYSPDIRTLNLLLSKWNGKGIRYRGPAHSHPPGLKSPSVGDGAYAERILKANPELPNLVVPIVQPTHDASPFQIFGFVAERTPNGVRFIPVPVFICDPAHNLQQPENLHPKHRLRACVANLFSRGLRRFDKGIFQRVVKAYDLELLRGCRVVIIGLGGIATTVEDLASAGVAEFVLIDGGRVEKCNIATQRYYHSDIGKFKVERLAYRLRQINPRVEIFEVPCHLEHLEDKLFKQIACDAFPMSPPPQRTVIIGATDNFFAQARVNRLALQFGLPSIACQLYSEAYGGEITFTHPETTPACHRCILSRRYQAYLDGYRNGVGSTGSPISSTSRINALTTFLTLAVLHHGTNHERWGGILRQIGDRNLIQIRCHPALQEKLDLPNFEEVFAGASSGQIFCDETIWRTQKPEHPSTGYEYACPDCGGTGDLTKVKGTFADTRLLPI